MHSPVSMSLKGSRQLSCDHVAPHFSPILACSSSLSIPTDQTSYTCPFGLYISSHISRIEFKTQCRLTTTSAMRKTTRPFDKRNYIKGCRLTVRQHVSAPPLQLETFKGCTFDSHERDKMEELHPIERCLQYPPLPGPYGSSSLELQIHDSV